MTASVIVGRSAELEAIDCFLDRLAREPAALVFEGQPGIGKTTVWRQVFERATRRSLTVLACRPVEAEAKLAFASLADLLEPVADTVLPQLPEPQRMALEVALMRTSPVATAPSARAVATAVLSALRLLAIASPVVLALDDLQWIDRASAEALAFALRRIGDHHVGVVVAMRVHEESPGDPLALDGAFAGHIERIRLGPLSLSALHHVIRSHLGHSFSRPALRRITEASGGNPFFALELARAAIEGGAHAGPSDPLPMSDTLTSLVLRRLGRLPARARATLLVASALSAPTVDLVRQVVGGDDAESSLAGAEQARFIEVHAQQIRFAHPLLASAVYSSASPEDRREAHRHLASVIVAPEERARHLALAAAQPDEDVARALDDASVLARRRGAPDAAGELQERAARLTPPGDTTASRLRRTRAAEYFFHAGDRAHARKLLETVLAEGAVGPERAKALHLLGQIRGQEDSFVDAIGHLEEALTYADEAATRVPIRLDLAFATFSSGMLPRAISFARDALSEAERLGEPGLIADALAVEVMGRFVAGLGSDWAGMNRALAMEDRTRAGQLLLRPTSIAGQMAVYEGRLSEADALLREMCDWATARGEESELPFLLFHLARLEWWRGDFAATARYAEEAIMLSVQSGSETMRSFGLAHRAAARVGSGDLAGARADLSESRTLVDKTGYMQGVAWLLASQGFLELSLGDAETAERTLAPLVAMIEETGVSEPFAAYFLPDAIEALIGVGQLSRAEVLLEPFARRAKELDRRWAIAGAARCRSLLVSAQGDLESGLAEAEDAVVRSQDLEMPVELGRALLALGQVRRRRGERRAAREAFERALAIFRDLGAPLWAERATEELRRIPIKRGPRADLTATEEQVAALAAAGRTNREIAGTLFMSPKTVEANLTRIYGKLGIRARAELGVSMLERRRAADPAKK
jgi:ATP/maltotriose-dependent transcriptional regulator MalT